MITRIQTRVYAPAATRSGAAARTPRPRRRTPDGPEAPGSRCGPFTILKRLAVGGMAEVYLGRADGGGLVALKILLPRLRHSGEYISMFADEANIGSVLRHHNIARVRQSGWTDERPYLAVEYVDGLPLKELITRHAGRGLPLPAFFAIADAVCAALEHAHQCIDDLGRPLNIVHRDVSPENVLVGNDGVVKLIDFGIAKARHRLARTAAHQVKGKLAYLAPEQLSGEALDSRTDIYGVGAVLYEMATGSDRFPDVDQFAMFRRIVDGSYPRPSQVRPGIHSVIERVIEGALMRTPADRYQSMGHLRRALRRAARRLRVAPLGAAQLAVWQRAPVTPASARNDALSAEIGTLTEAPLFFDELATTIRPAS